MHRRRASGADMTGRVVLVTGATSGIGREAAVQLAARGADVIMTGRHPDRSAATLDDVRRRSGSPDVGLVALDLASLASVRACAAEVLRRWDRLDVLVCNAGGYHSDRHETEDGHELTFGVNHLGHFLLASLVADRLVASAPARVVVVSSLAHRAAGGLSWSELAERPRYDAWAAYAESKLANLVFASTLAERLVDDGVTVTSCHPGTVRSRFASADDANGAFRLGVVVARPFFVSPRRGAAPLVALAADSRYQGVTGRYYSGGYLPVHRSRPAKAGRDPVVARRLWALSEALVARAEARGVDPYRGGSAATGSVFGPPTDDDPTGGPRPVVNPEGADR